MKINKKHIATSHHSKEYTDKLWLSFIHGDNACFEIIYNLYIDSLFRYGIQFTRNEEVVKDAIHDVFVKLYVNRSKLKQEVHLKFYLFTALKNTLYNLFKRELLFEKLDEKELSDILDHAAEDEMINSAEKDAVKEEIGLLLNVLSERQREVIYYRYIEEMNMEEICSLMHMNYQSVQNLIQRSLKKLRENPRSFTLISFLFYSPINMLSKI